MKILLALILALPAIARADDKETDCRQHLTKLAGAVKAYRLIHNDKSPAKLSDLYLDGLVDSVGYFVCPASGTSISSSSEIDAKSSYALGTGNELIRETAARHGDKALAIMNDGSIKPVVAALDKRGPESDAPAPPRSTSAATTSPTGPTTVMRDAGLPPSPPPPVTHPSAPPMSEDPPPPQDESQFHVTKADPGMAVSVGGSFGDFMGVTFAFQADGKLVVSSVKSDSIASDIGLKTGDPVVELNEKPAPKGTGARAVSSSELAKLAGVSAGQSILITVQKSDGEKVSFSFMGGLPPLPGQ